MSSKALCLIARCSIVVIALCGLCVCVYPLPFSAIFSAFFPVVGGDITIYIFILFLELSTLPCFFILIVIWKMTNAVKEEKVFTKKVAKQISLCAKILFIDLGVFFIGNIVFAILQANAFFLFYLFAIIIGVIVACFGAVLSHYINKAAEIKEEIEATI